MLVAEVALDVQTKSLDSAFTYEVPQQFEEVDVGCAVLVPLGNRKVIGFVVAVYKQDESEITYAMKPILDVLSSPYFTCLGAECAKFLAKRYLAPLSACVRLFVPAGAVPKVVKNQYGGWSIKAPTIGQVEAKWVSLIDPDFVPKKNAAKQKMIIDTLKHGSMKLSELNILLGNSTSVVNSLHKKGVLKVENRRVYRVDDKANSGEIRHFDLQLTDEQAGALAKISDAIDRQNGSVVLVDGVTGSGKTEVYLRAISKVLADGKTAIVLVPEISLTAQTVSRFRERFGDQVGLLHSKMSQGERYDQLSLIREGKTRVVIGPRSALFAPLKDLGIIIIDEEHETTYKQESAPRYVSRDVASWMAEKSGVTLVLGSATPSIEALYKANTQQNWEIALMPTRVNGKKMPKIQVVDMSQNPSKRIFSDVLKQAIKDELKSGHKVVLLLNQRGFARFLLCRECGFVPQCNQCSTTLTYHERGNKLICHHCGNVMPGISVCPKCQSPYLSRQGIGTQRVEDEIHSLLNAELGVTPQIVAPNNTNADGFSAPDSFEDDNFDNVLPADQISESHSIGEIVSKFSDDYSDVEVIRMDADTTSKKGAHENLLEQFMKADRAILLGTQMIAKGLDFDDVTLVGVINADTQLHLPDFRSGERTFDLIEQVAGRAGRANLEGKVIVQTYEPDSIAIQAAASYNRDLFLRSELPKRKMLSFPPYVRMANILVWGKDLSAVKREISDIYELVSEGIQKLALTDWEITTPISCVLEKIRNDFRWHFVVKCPNNMDLSDPLHEILGKRPASKYTNMAIDIDPIDLL